jgi:hypothetical protein
MAESGEGDVIDDEEEGKDSEDAAETPGTEAVCFVCLGS